jgi:hypothetical protein
MTPATPKFRLLADVNATSTNTTTNGTATTTSAVVVVDPPIDFGGDGKYYGASSLLIFLFGICFAYITARIGDRNNESNASSSLSLSSELAAQPRLALLYQVLAEMNLKDRRKYYNELFEKNKNQIILTSDQIIEMTIVEKDIEPHGESDDEEPSLYLSLGNIWNSSIIRRNSMLGIRDCSKVTDDFNESQDNTDCKSKKQRLSSVIIHTSDDNDDEKRNKNKKIIQGNCIICFENFQIGETIVYSIETQNSNYVYHKECMVEYLTKQKVYKGGRQQKVNNNDNNPSCPTCRQTFCKLVPIDDIIIDSIDSNNTRTNNKTDADDDTDGDDDIVSNCGEQSATIRRSPTTTATTATSSANEERAYINRVIGYAAAFY